MRNTITSSPVTFATETDTNYTPREITAGPLHAITGDAIQLGTYASGEPIVVTTNEGRGGRCEVIMIDEEGQPARYRGIEGFLQHLEVRSKQSKFELAAWKDG